MRWVAGAILFFLIDAAQLLFLVPDRTDELWAWEIQPETTSLVLASAYVAGGYFFARLLFGAPWREVASGFRPITVFVCVAAAATFLHLDRFIEDNLAFAAWITLYVVTPFGVPALYLYERRRAGPPPAGELSRRMRIALAVIGGAVMLGALVMLVSPSTAMDAWPWTLTPLTTRIVSAVIALYGAVWVSIAADGTRARITLEAHVLGLAFFLVALVRGGDDVDWDRPLAPVLAAAAVAMLVVSLAVSRQPRAS
jgi:hypothetical protein